MVLGSWGRVWHFPEIQWHTFVLSCQVLHATARCNRMPMASDLSSELLVTLAGALKSDLPPYDTWYDMARDWPPRGARPSPGAGAGAGTSTPQLSIASGTDFGPCIGLFVREEWNPTLTSQAPEPSTARSPKTDTARIPVPPAQNTSNDAGKQSSSLGNSTDGSTASSDSVGVPSSVREVTYSTSQPVTLPLPLDPGLETPILKFTLPADYQSTGSVLNITFEATLYYDDALKVGGKYLIGDDKIWTLFGNYLVVSGEGPIPGIRRCAPITLHHTLHTQCTHPLSTCNTTCDTVQWVGHHPAAISHSELATAHGELKLHAVLWADLLVILRAMHLLCCCNQVLYCCC